MHLCWETLGKLGSTIAPSKCGVGPSWLAWLCLPRAAFTGSPDSDETDPDAAYAVFEAPAYGSLLSSYRCQGSEDRGSACTKEVSQLLEGVRARVSELLQEDVQWAGQPAAWRRGLGVPEFVFRKSLGDEPSLSTGAHPNRVYEPLGFGRSERMAVDPRMTLRPRARRSTNNRCRSWREQPSRSGEGTTNSSPGRRASSASVSAGGLDRGRSDPCRCRSARSCGRLRCGAPGSGAERRRCCSQRGRSRSSWCGSQRVHLLRLQGGGGSGPA